MRYFAALVLGMLAVGTAMGQPSAAGQAPAQTDSQLLQAILTEMRGIHEDVRLSQTTQILLTEMEVQRGVVDKAVEKRDAARNRVSQLQMNEKNFATQLTQIEENAGAVIDPVQQKQMAQQEQMLKTNIANFKSQEVDTTNAVADAESTLRREQDVLDGIQGQLDDVVKKLQPAGK